MSESIGEKLKQAREERHLTLDQAAETTRIRVHYLQALESGDLSSIPSAAQARGFLRIYASFLGLDPDSLVSLPQPVETPSASDSETAPVPAPEPPRPNLLTSLRERFGRRADANEAAPISEPEPSLEVHLAAPGPEPFVPVRYKEELPAEPSPMIEEPASAEGPKAKPPRRKTTVKKSATKTTRSSASGAGIQADVKKKIMESVKSRKSHVKRLSLRHNL